MKVAVVYNRESLRVINLFGARNREKYRVEAIKRIMDALKKSRHQVKAFEGDKDLIANLESFMPSVVKGERPGMVLNLAYGIQGQARYTQIPSILEMVGIPYVGSGPLSHSLSLDKAVAKVMFRQNGLPTPDFAVLEGPGLEMPDLPYPLIVKPRSEADSFGMQIVGNEGELRRAVEHVFREFEQPVLVERYIDGRELNVGLLGNPPDAFPPVELDFGDGPRIYTNDDKGGRSGRTVGYIRPVGLDEEITAKARDIAKKAFSALGCFDCGRVDMRMDADGNLYLLEMNSLPSLGYRGSYVTGAEHAGMDFMQLVNRLLEIASARYFGTEAPTAIPEKPATPREAVLKHLTGRRDRMEKRLKELVSMRSRLSDAVGILELVRNLDARFLDMGLRRVDELSDEHAVRTWETAKGMAGGTLFIAHVDSLLGSEAPSPAFRRDPEWLYGEAVGVSRAPIVMLEFSLQALRNLKRLRQQRIGVLVYADEGHDCRYSRDRIAEAAGRAGQVIVLRPGTPTGRIITRRRGLRKYQLVVEGVAQDIRRMSSKSDVLRWTMNRLESMAGLSTRKGRLDVFAADIETARFPMLLPHRVMVSILVSYPDAKAADEAEEKIGAILGKGRPRWKLHLVSDRPPMPERGRGNRLLRDLLAVASEWEIPLDHDTSVLPSVAGLVPRKTPVLCGFGPIVREPYTPQEAVLRSSLFRMTLLLSQFLAKDFK